jgi:hypothetical protein
MTARTLPGRRYQWVARVLLALVFVVAQGGAEAHSYSHLVKERPGAPSTTQGCDERLSSAPLLAGAGNPQADMLLPASEGRPVAPATSVPVSSLSRPSSFQSRAPPSLL